MSIIYLIGYMGAGKTTLGDQLAKEYNAEFIDLDHYIQQKYDKTIGQLFEEHGEDGFRLIEHNALKELGNITSHTIIATGGGAPCFYNNMEIMNTTGTTIYLKASPQALTNRLNIPEHKMKRPLIKDKSEKELLSFITDTLSKREKFYNQAKVIFTTEHLTSRENVAMHIEELKGIISI